MKLKIYLDTNTVIDFFINEARSLKKGEEPKIPKKFGFMAEKSSEIDFITSFITKAEIVRELSSAFQLSNEEIEKLWDSFLKSIDCEYIDNFLFDEKIVKLATGIRMRLRTMFNFMHVFIAMDKDAHFLSGDKDIINKIREHKIYDKTLTYIELRKRF